MNNRVYIIVLFCCGCSITNYTARRQRILFINQAPEIVYVSIHLEPSEPFEREAVPFRGRKYFFPEIINEDNVYYIDIKSASQEVSYTLHLYGNLAMSSVRACRAYGDLELMRRDLVVQSLSASSLAAGLVFTYTLDFRLEISLAYVADRPHQPACRQQRCHTGGCVCMRKCNTCVPVSKQQRRAVKKSNDFDDEWPSQ